MNHGWPKGCNNYSSILLYYIVLFRSFRACENLLLRGYPFDGYALLRNLKDRTIFLAGIAHNITTLPSILGFDGSIPITVDNKKKLTKSCKTEEFRVLNRIIRKKSGLPPQIIKELDNWEQLFHYEVHGSKFTFFNELGDWLKSGNPPSIGPTAKESNMVLYMNRCVEIAWLIVRLLPYILPEENAFGNRWNEKHKILDESFRYAENALAEGGKKIGDAFIIFVDKKFNFKEPFYYFEANGSQ